MSRRRIVDASGDLVAGAEAVFRVTIRRRGEVVNLSGKTVVGTIMRAAFPYDLAVPGLQGLEGTVTDVEGGEATFNLDTGQTLLMMVPNDPAAFLNYYLQVVVMPDNYPPDIIRFKAWRPGADLPIPVAP